MLVVVRQGNGNGAVELDRTNQQPLPIDAGKVGYSHGKAGQDEHGAAGTHRQILYQRRLEPGNSRAGKEGTSGEGGGTEGNPQGDGSAVERI